MTRSTPIAGDRRSVSRAAAREIGADGFFGGVVTTTDSTYAAPLFVEHLSDEPF